MFVALQVEKADVFTIAALAHLTELQRQALMAISLTGAELKRAVERAAVAAAADGVDGIITTNLLAREIEQVRVMPVLMCSHCRGLWQVCSGRYTNRPHLLVCRLLETSWPNLGCARTAFEFASACCHNGLSQHVPRTLSSVVAHAWSANAHPQHVAAHGTACLAPHQV